MSRRHGIDRALLALGGLVVVSSVRAIRALERRRRPLDRPRRAALRTARALARLGRRSRLARRACPVLQLPLPVARRYPVPLERARGRGALGAAAAGGRHVADCRSRSFSGRARSPEVAGRSLRAGLTLLMPGLVVQRLVHERGALLPRRDGGRLGARGCLDKPDTRPSGLLLVAVAIAFGDEAAGGGASPEPSCSRWLLVAVAERSLAPVPPIPADALRARRRRSRLGRAPRLRAGGVGELLGGVRTVGGSRRVLARRHRPVAGLADRRGGASHRRCPACRARRSSPGRCCADASRSRCPRARRLCARVRRRHARRGRCVRVSLRGARDRAPAALRRAAYLRGVRGVARAWCAQAAARDLDRRIRGRRSSRCSFRSTA